jgi:hypothetical protein
MANKRTKKQIERREALIRIPIAIISGLILEIWANLTIILSLVNFFIVIFTSKRNRDISDFSEYFNSYAYSFFRYITFNTNERPFPFAPLKKMNKFEK